MSCSRQQHSTSGQCLTHDPLTVSLITGYQLSELAPQLQKLKGPILNKFLQGLTLTTFFSSFFLVDEGEEGSKYHYKRTIISTQAKHNLNGLSLVYR